MTARFRDFQARWNEAYAVACSFSIGECDSDCRKVAIDALHEAYESVKLGCQRISDERRKEEEARVLAAWREGRVTIHEHAKA